MVGSSNTLIILVVVAMCVSSSSCAMSVIGPFGGLFSGTGGAESAQGGFVGSGIVDLKSVVCEKCAAQNWTGSVTAFGKPVECSEAKAKCAGRAATMSDAPGADDSLHPGQSPGESGGAKIGSNVGWKTVDLKSVVCEKCAAQNWTGSVTAFNKEVPCSKAKAIC